MAIFEIEGAIQNYAWGSKTAIAEFQGRAPSEEPEAELWLGTHPRGPSRVVGGPGVGGAGGASSGAVRGGVGDLREFAGAELPFLFKLLAAELPLSLQAHPSLAQAEEGFLREERAGVPIDAPTRNYRDRNHKPELLCARTEFHALSGFRPVEESLALVDAVGLRSVVPSFFESLAAGDLNSAFRGLFELEKEQLRGAIEVVGHWAKVAATLPNAAADVAPWLALLAQSHPIDPGVLAALLLNYVRLQPGEAMYLPAGNLHAYLSGVGLELMASSDNVMRGGLTPKHVNVQELCHILEFSPHLPEVLSGAFEERGDYVRECVYRTAAAEFELRRVEVSRAQEGTVQESAVQMSGAEVSGAQMSGAEVSGTEVSGAQVSGAGSYEVVGPALVLVESGEVELFEGAHRLVLGAGRSGFVSAGSVVGLVGEGTAAIASLPRDLPSLKGAEPPRRRK